MIPLNAPSLGPLERGYVLQALDSGWITGGTFVRRFEERFAKWVGRQYAVACSSGTAALWLALTALRLPKESAVVTSSYTCDAVANAVIHVTGVPPMLVDVEDETWGPDRAMVRYYLAGRKTFNLGAVVLPHTYGVIARDTEDIEALCAEAGVPLIEDASEAHGATVHGREAGSFGVASIFSLRGEKTLGGGQFGVVVTDDEDLARRVHQYAYCGLPVDRLRFWSTVPGMNFQPAHLNAALACAQLERADELIAARRVVHQGWRDRLSLPGVTFQAVHGEPAWWLTGILIDTDFTGLLPSDLALGLAERGIETRPAFYPIYRLPHCRGRVYSHEIAERLLRQMLVLPSGPGITPEQQDVVVEAILQITGRA